LNKYSGIMVKLYQTIYNLYVFSKGYSFTPQHLTNKYNNTDRKVNLYGELF